MDRSSSSEQILTLDTDAMPWQDHFNQKLGRMMYKKPLVQDPDTGMKVDKTRYPAGFVTPWHSHHCAHGMYVLEGTLQTHQGQYGPGSFVWFPEGVLAEHGATKEQDVVVLFITNKLFDISYVEKDKP